MKKLFVGPRIRRLREQHQLNQMQCASKLGLSPSYLNQIENNQRPVSASVLIKLSNVFNIDVAQFADNSDAQLAADINLALKDPFLADSQIQWQEVEAFTQQQPELATSFTRLYQRFSRLQEEYQQLVSRFYGEQHTAHLSPLPHEEVRDYFYRHNNYIDLLDQAAEQLYRQQDFDRLTLHQQLQDYLRTAFDVTVNIDQPPQSGALRHYDSNTRQLFLSSQLQRFQQCFQMASQIALLDQDKQISLLCADADFSSEQTQRLARIGLANYFAGALLMPYGAFMQVAEQQRYDIDALCQHFRVSTEQVCHRLSTLQRSGQKGIPFYFVRVDQAGNISKRQSATSFHFARTGGACPLWNVHEAFGTDRRVLTQIAQMPDGQQFFCIAREVTQGGGSYHARVRRFAIGLGCELQHAHRLVYADGLDLNSKALVTPIGPGCRVCPRNDCTQRAFPQAGRPLDINDQLQAAVPYRADDTV
ncbi:helix-turn-helix domain-containing protein [Spongiibacter tropicus]|uniref:helix-turn-helix domain-containing protein n=1 Tax=Spongiibacter tropicus TaxID=454602 RepID=UPI0035BE9F8E